MAASPFADFSLCDCELALVAAAASDRKAATAGRQRDAGAE